ncbi:MAG: TetR/AcrR family transcriptional regulator [Phenylobacterium sp.]|uniref:TetR/AcrR family transcriptional regulator n=1 Tax=Phenylobacterium sp. TaxID=1871053 RepID=UPI00391A2A56
MSAVKAPTRRYEERKAAIVASAIEVMNRKGVRGMTLAEVAARLRLVPTGVIYYFRNKEELAGACLLQSIGRFEELLAAGEAGRSARERLTLFLAAYFQLQQQVTTGEACPLAVFNDMRALDRAPVNEAFVNMFRRTRNLLSGPETADLPRLARNARTHLLLAEVFWTVAWLHAHDPEDFGRVSQRFAAVAADGLAAPGAVWRPVPLPAPACAVAPETSAEAFLRAATQLINEKGYLGASVERISARLNVTKGAFYHHNDTKDELVIACFDRTFEVMAGAIRQAEALGGNGLQTLATVAANLVAYQLRGDAPLLRTSALTSAPEALQPELLKRFDRLSYRFASIISDGIADGSIRPVDVNIAAQMVTAMINAAAELHAFAPELSPEAAADVFVRPFFEGLLTP